MRSPRSTSSASIRRSRGRKTRSWPSDGGDRSYALAAPRGRHHGRQRALGGAARPLAPAGAPRRQGIGAGGGRGQPAPRHPLPLALRLLYRELAPPAARGRRAHGAPPPLPGDRARQDDEASYPPARRREPPPPAANGARRSEEHTSELQSRYVISY